MFQDMGSISAGSIDRLIEMTSVYLRDAMTRGEYFGWVVSPRDELDRVVAGAGVQVRRVLPFPRRGKNGREDVSYGRQAIVLNVYTERQFRRQGLARALMHEVLEWARTTGVESLVLHGAPDGRPLYEALEFAATNEMRFMGDIAEWRHPLERRIL